MNAFKMLGRPEILVGVEPDERCTDPLWIDKIVAVMEADPTLAYVGMGQSHFSPMYDHLLQGKWNVAGHLIKQYSQAMGWAMGAFAGSFLSNVGVKSDPYYGNLEPLTASAMNKNGFEWALLDGVNAIHFDGPKEYERWKVESGDRKTRLEFDAWLKSQG